MSFWNLLLAHGALTRLPDPNIKGKRLEPTIPLTDRRFKYTPSTETDLRTKWYGTPKER